MQFKSLTPRLALVLAAFIGIVSSAQAAVLPFNSTIGGAPVTQGGTLVATQTIPFNAPGFYSGTLLSQVYTGDPSNANGGLTFVYKVSNTAGPNSIGRFTINDYSTFATDAGYLNATGTAPAFADRDSVPGDVIGFSFFRPPVGPGAISAGTSSATLVVQTNATLYQTTFASVIDGTVTTVASLAPAVPEPATLSLLAVGAGLVLRRRTR